MMIDNLINAGIGANIVVGDGGHRQAGTGPQQLYVFTLWVSIVWISKHDC